MHFDRQVLLIFTVFVRSVLGKILEQKLIKLVYSLLNTLPEISGDRYYAGNNTVASIDVKQFCLVVHIQNWSHFFALNEQATESKRLNFVFI